MAEDDLPRALIPAARTTRSSSRRRCAGWRDVVARGIDAAVQYRALADLLRNAPPRVRGVRPAPPSRHAPRRRHAWPIVDGLDGSYLVIQGPPGSGKTYPGARLIVPLIAAGQASA